MKEYSEYFKAEQRSQSVPRVRMATGEVLGSVLSPQIEQADGESAKLS